MREAREWCRRFGHVWARRCGVWNCYSCPATVCRRCGVRPDELLKFPAAALNGRGG